MSSVSEHDQDTDSQAGSETGLPTWKGRGRRPKLAKFFEEAQDHYRQILKMIELGAYGHVAAQAFGVNLATWNLWKSKGWEHYRKGKNTIYRRFVEDVSQAEARARLVVELEVRREDPKFWLKNGPGKTKTGNPGWTDSIAMVGDAAADPMSIESQVDAKVSGVEKPGAEDLARTIEVLEGMGILAWSEATEATYKAGSSNVPKLPAPENGLQNTDSNTGLDNVIDVPSNGTAKSEGDGEGEVADRIPGDAEAKPPLSPPSLPEKDELPDEINSLLQGGHDPDDDDVDPYDDNEEDDPGYDPDGDVPYDQLPPKFR